MTRTSNLESWINIAKLGVAAGELAPFPYIKGLCGCAVVVLEAIEKAGKNNEDLLDLADSIQKTIERVQSTVKEHGESSALRFREVCAELEVYLTDLHIQLNNTRRKSRGIKRFLKTKNVSDAINSYRERVHNIKGDFLIHTAIDSGFVISDIKDRLRTGTNAITGAIEMSQRHTISNIDKRAYNICEEISTWGVLQSQKADKLRADIQMLKERGSYKGFVRDILPGDIYLGGLLGPPNHAAVFSDYNADINNVPKIVRVYRNPNEQDVMKQFHIDVDKLINSKHRNIAQIYGVCRSPDLTAIILHGTTQGSIRNHCASLTAIQLLHFHIQLVNDLESVSDYLGRLCHTFPQGWTDEVRDGNLSSVYINERGQIVFAGLSSRYYLNQYIVDIIQNGEVRPDVTFSGHWTASRVSLSDSIRDCNSLMCRSTSLAKDHLIEIYVILCRLIGVPVEDTTLVYDPENEYPRYGRGSVSTRTELAFPVDTLVVGEIPVELAMMWYMHKNGYSIWCSAPVTIGSLSVIQKHSIAVMSATVYRTSSEDCTKSDLQMMYSLFAQASRLSLSSSQNPSSIYGRHNTKYVQGWCSTSEELGNILTNSSLLDTFMADSEYAFALSLTVCEPHLHSQSNTISWPVIHWFCDPNLSNEISLEEAEALFGIKVSLYAVLDQYRIPKKPLSTIVEINTMCGFDPALKGADICEYFDLPRMEVFENPVKYPPDRKIKQIALPTPVHDYKDTTDTTPITDIRAEKQTSTSHAQNRLIAVLVALIQIVLLSLVIHLSIKV